MASCGSRIPAFQLGDPGPGTSASSSVTCGSGRTAPGGLEAERSPRVAGLPAECTETAQATRE